jgi:hypothetical protein
MYQEIEIKHPEASDLPASLSSGQSSWLLTQRSGMKVDVVRCQQVPSLSPECICNMYMYM